MAKIKFWYVLMFTGLSTLASAQLDFNVRLSGFNLKVTAWSSREGLPSWHVWDIMEDATGQLWLATDEGLVRFNREQFSMPNLTVPDSLKTQLLRVVEDVNKNLWLYYADRDDVSVFIYDRFDQTTSSIEHYIGRSLASIKRNAIMAIKQEVWILDPSQELYGKYGLDGNWHEFPFNIEAPEEITACFPLDENRIWLVNGVKQTIYIQNRTGEVLVEYALKDFGMGHKFSLSKDGDLFLFSSQNVTSEEAVTLYKVTPTDGFYRIQPTERDIQAWSNAYYNDGIFSPIYRAHNTGGFEISITKDAYNIYHKGVLICRGLDKYLAPILGVDINSFLFVSSDGSFWLTAPNLLIRLQVQKNYFTNYLNRDPIPFSTRGIAHIGDQLFVNSQQGFLQLRMQERHAKMEHWEPYMVGSIMEEHQGRIWNALEKNFVRAYEPSSGVVQDIPYSDRQIHFGTDFLFDKDGAVFLATTDGVWKYSGKRFELWSLPETKVGKLYQNDRGIWAGSAQGLVLLNSSGFIQKRIVLESSYSSTTIIRDIYEDADGAFWLATDNGLWHGNPDTGKFRVFNKGNSLISSNQLCAIYPDKQGRLWIPSFNGLIYFEKDKEVFHTFYKEDGLSNNEFNSYSHTRMADGQLFLGGVAGVVAFYPDSIPLLPAQAITLHLDELKLQDHDNGKSEILTRQARAGEEAIVVKPFVDQLSISFYVPDENPERVKYRWRFLSGDSLWNSMESPNLELFNLPYGAYPLEVQAARLGGTPLEASSVLIHLDVRRPFYMTLWFLTGLSLFGTTLIYLYILARQRRLKRFNSWLGDEVARKTAQLRIEKELVAKQAAKLQAMSEEQNRLFQDVSHELRHPLSLVLGPANDMLKNEALPDEFRSPVARVSRNARKIQNLIEEILALTKLDAGKVELSLSSVKLHTFLSTVFDNQRDRFQRKQLNYQVENCIPVRLKTRVDSEKLEKILNNLLDNALKYTETGAVVVRVFLDSGKYLVVEVQDTGVGIPEEDIARIFDRYYRAKTSSVLFAGGLGVGLAMARQYALIMGGDLSAQSTPGKGTIMRLQLPISVPLGEGLESTGLQENTEHCAEKIRERGDGGQVILLLLDNPAKESEVGRLLREKELCVSVVRHTNEALHFINGYHPDLIIWDMSAPMSDQWKQLYEYLRHNHKYQKTPLLFLVPPIHFSSYKEKVNSGDDAQYMLAKPLHPEELLLIVRSLLPS